MKTQPYDPSSSRLVSQASGGMQSTGKVINSPEQGSKGEFLGSLAWEALIKPFSVKVKAERPWFQRGITSEHGEGKRTTIGSGGLLSANTDKTELAAPSLATPHHTFKHSNSLIDNNYNVEQLSKKKNMAPPKRVKYKEASAVAPVEPASEETQMQQQEQPPLTQFQPHSKIQPHPQTPLLPAANITETTPDTTAAHVATLNEDASSVPKALVPYSSSSSSSTRHSATSIDSAVEMGGKGKGRSKPRGGGKDRELVFKGRLSADPSTATTNSWRYDQSAGALVSNASGQTWRPALAKKSSKQNLNNGASTWYPDPSKPQKTSNANGWEVGNSAHTLDNKASIDSWAFPPPAKLSSQEKDWSPDTTGGWGSQHPALPTQAQGDGASRKYMSPQAPTSDRPRNHNGRVRKEPKPRKPRESPWIKDSDIPKGDPNRHKTCWSSTVHGSSTDNSDRPSSGWGTRRKRKEGAGLIRDWAGGMGPAMIDWDSRAQFRDHQSADRIETWLDRTCLSLEDVELVKFTNGGQTFTFIKTEAGNQELGEEEQGDVVPRYWFSPSVDELPADLFWAAHIHEENDLQPMDEEDLEKAKPWWKYYVNGQCTVLKVLEHPMIKGIDPDESQSDRLAREHDEGGANAIANRRAAEQAKRTAHRARLLAKRDKAHKFTGVRNASGTSTSPNGIKTSLNLFLRSAHKEDMVQLRDIYNRYIDNALVVPETSRLTETDMLKRWNAIRSNNLPFIVACQRGEKIKGRKQRGNTGEDVIMCDRVVGFACAANWTEETSIYRPTVQLEIFVHMEYYMKKIGSCLADKMMGLLDPNFIERGGYDTVGDELDGVGPSRIVSNVMVRYSYEEQKPDKMKWVTKWLKERLGLEKVADLQRVAIKFDKRLNLAILQKTVEGAVPSGVPAVSGDANGA